MRLDGIRIERKVSCMMRDGVILYADVYRPEADGPYPVLLMRQPYGKELASTVTYAHPIWYAQQGFIVVIQDVRGRGESEGEFDPFVQEVSDGYDTVEWAAALPDSNGKVGMYGFSYQGITQWAAAASRPPHLAAIAPGMCAADLYSGMFYPHGRFSIGAHLPWAFQLARDSARRAGDGETEQLCTQLMRNPDTALWQTPLVREHPALTRYFPTYYDWCRHTSYDEYWEERNWLKYVADSPIPSLHIGGWYDTYLTGTLQSFEALQTAEKTSGLFHRLIVGPWVHIPWGKKAGGFDFGPDADGNLHNEHIRWFNYWLKGRSNELWKEPVVRYYEFGSRVWLTAEQSHFMAGGAAGGDGIRWYLANTGQPANGASGGGALVAEQPGESHSLVDALVYDSRLPMLCDSYLPIDRSVLEERFEILNYTSAPFEQTIHAAGSPELTLWCQVAGGPTDLVAVLTLMGVDGSSRFLSIGRTEAGKMADKAERADTCMRLQFKMRPFAAALTEGCSIRIEITGSAFPLFARHPNGRRAEELPDAGPGDLQMATIAVVHRKSHPSWIEIPIKQRGS